MNEFFVLLVRWWVFTLDFSLIQADIEHTLLDLWAVNVLVQKIVLALKVLFKCDGRMIYSNCVFKLYNDILFQRFRLVWIEVYQFLIHNILISLFKNVVKPIVYNSLNERSFPTELRSNDCYSNSLKSRPLIIFHFFIKHIVKCNVSLV